MDCVDSHRCGCYVARSRKNHQLWSSAHAYLPIIDGKDRKSRKVELFELGCIKQIHRKFTVFLYRDLLRPISLIS
jgi:hypothetical protein